MAVQTWYYASSFYGAAPAFGVMQSNDPGTEITLAEGWTAGTGTTNRSKFSRGNLRASTTFDSTTYPNGTPDTTILDCLYIGAPSSPSNPQSGTYASGNWVFSFCVRAVTNAGCSGKIHIRLFKS